MSKDQEACLVLCPEGPREKFEKVATQLGFVHVETRPDDGDRVAYEQVWATPDKLKAANDLEDPMVNVHYMSLRSLTSVRRIKSEFAQRIEYIPDEELLEDAIQVTEHNEQVRAINRLAIKFVEYHPTAFALIEAGPTQPPHPLVTPLRPFFEARLCNFLGHLQGDGLSAHPPLSQGLQKVHPRKWDFLAVSGLPSSKTKAEVEFSRIRVDCYGGSVETGVY